jgi:hypothetical protein
MMTLEKFGVVLAFGNFELLEGFDMVAKPLR